jgi:hypothetical protein
MQSGKRCVTSDFRHKVDQIHIRLAYYIVSSGNPVSTFRHHLKSLRSPRIKQAKKKTREFLEFLSFEDGTGRSS